MDSEISKKTKTIWFAIISIVILSLAILVYFYQKDAIKIGADVSTGQQYQLDNIVVGDQGGLELSKKSALSFNGIDDYVQIPDNDAIDFARDQNFTIETMVKLPENQNDIDVGDNAIIEKWQGGSDPYSYVIRVYNEEKPEREGEVYCCRYAGAPAQYGPGVSSGDIRLNDNEFHHIACSRDNGNLKLFIDGNLVDEQNETEDPSCNFSDAVTTNNSPLYIGRRGDQSEQFDTKLTGVIDNVRMWRIARTAEEIKSNMNKELTPGSEALLVADWRFDEGTGTTINNSISGGVNGTVNGTPSWVYNYANIGTAILGPIDLSDLGTVESSLITWDAVERTVLSFDGVNDYVQIPDNDAIDFARDQNFTIETMVKLPENQNDIDVGDNAIIEKWQGGSDPYSYVIRVYNEKKPEREGEVYCCRYAGAPAQYGPGVSSGDIRLNDNEFHHIACSRDNGNLKLFIDGNLVDTQNETEDPSWNFSDAVTTNNSPLYIGRRGDQTDKFDIKLTGIIDNVRIWRIARTAEEIKSNMNKELIPASETLLVADWRFDEGTGTVAGNSNGNNSLDGTVHGAIFGSTNVEITTSLDGNQWDTPQNGGEIPGLSMGKDLTNTNLYLKALLTTNESNITPVLNSLIVLVDGQNIIPPIPLPTIKPTVKPTSKPTSISKLARLVSTGGSLWINLLIALGFIGGIGYFIFRKDIWKK